MIKKLITGTALIVAGTALAGAAETITLTPTVEDSNGGSYYGFTFSLDEDTYTNDAGYTLDSMTVVLRYSGSGNLPSSPEYFVVYSYDSSLSSLTYVGYSAITYTTNGTVVYNAAGDGYWTRNTASSSTLVGTDGETLVLSSGVTYYVAFVTTDNLSAAQSLTSFSSSTLGSLHLYADTSVAGGLATTGSFVDSSGSATATNYSAVVAATLTEVEATIPEPSAFGILAGFGALALAASRRRRSRKVA